METTSHRFSGCTSRDRTIVQYFHAVYSVIPMGDHRDRDEPNQVRARRSGSRIGFRPQPKENLIGGRDEVLTAAEPGLNRATVTEDFALRGFHHITSISSNAERTENFFVEMSDSV